MIAARAEILTYLGLASTIDDADLALLDMVHRSSEAAVNNYMQAQLGYARYVELLPAGQPYEFNDAVIEPYNRNGTTIEFTTKAQVSTNALQLRHLPVFLEGLEVREDTGSNGGQGAHAFATETILQRGDDYYLDVDDPAAGLSRTGIVYRIGTWPTEPRSVKVTYYGGLNAERLNEAWADVKMAAIIAAAEEFQVAKRRQGEKGAVQGESIGKYSYSLAGNSGAVSADGGHSLPPGSIQRLFRHRNLGRLFG